MAKMFLMSGSSGSGKTTFAKEFAKANGFRYLCVDDFYAVFLGSPIEHTHEFEVWQSFYQAIHLAEMDDVDCVIDTNSPSLVDRIQFINWFPGFSHHLIYLYADKDLCWKNIQKRERKIPKETFDSIYSSCIAPKPGEDKRWYSITYLLNEYNNIKIDDCVYGDGIAREAPIEIWEFVNNYCP